MKEPGTRKILATATLILIAAVAAVFVLRGQNPASPANTSRAEQAPSAILTIPKAKHVVMVVEENARYESVMGNTADMPYLNSLANKYSYAKNYYANKHPSIAGYFTLTAGKTISTNNDFKDTVSEDNIVRQLVAAGKTWKEYSESLLFVGYTGGDTNFYRQHHNPFSYFSDVRESEEQLRNLVPLEQLAADLRNDNLPDFALIIPDNRHNMHDCPSGIFCKSGEKRKAADEWLKDNIKALIESPEFSQPGGGLLIITADEGSKADPSHGGGHTFWIAIGPDVKKGYASDTFFQHESTLRLMMQSLGLSNFPRNAANAPDMGEFLSDN